MNNLVTSPVNICRPNGKEYKMLPLERSPGAYSIKVPKPAPKIGPNDPLIPYRVLKITDDVATICANMTKLVNKELTVRDVDVSSLGKPSVRVDDIVAFKTSDVTFSKPFIMFRSHQKHRHPEQLVAPDEK